MARICKQFLETLIGIDHIGLMQHHRISAPPLRSADASHHMTLGSGTAGDDETRRTGDAPSRVHISISSRQESHVAGRKGRGADALRPCGDQSR
jgi:hypothetical protein